MSTASPNAAGSAGGVMRWLVGAAVILLIVAIGVFAGTQTQVAAVRKDDMKFMADNGKKPGVVTTDSGLQ
jgi:poly(3-hydroxybutyrate) depolymerase